MDKYYLHFPIPRLSHHVYLTIFLIVLSGCSSTSPEPDGENSNNQEPGTSIVNKTSEGGNTSSTLTVLSLTRNSNEESRLVLSYISADVNYEYSIYQTTTGDTECGNLKSQVIHPTRVTGNSTTVTDLSYANAPYCVQARYCSTITSNCSPYILSYREFAPVKPTSLPNISSVDASTLPVVVAMTATPPDDWQYQYQLSSASGSTTGTFDDTDVSFDDLSVDNNPYTIKVRFCTTHEASYCTDYGSSQSFNVLSATASTVSFSAWVSPDNAQVNFKNAGTDYEFYRSQDKSCDIDTYTSCTKPGLDIVNNIKKDVTDHALTLSTDSYYTLINSETRGRANLEVAANVKEKLPNIPGKIFTSRYNHAMALFNDRLYIAGGSYSDGSSTTPIIFNDIWSSSDGVNWQRDTANAQFTAREGHDLAVLGNWLYLIGGNDGTNNNNEIWRTQDGITWEQVVTYGDMFSARSYHQSVTFNNQLYVIGGNNGGNEIWRSSNGITWQRIITNSDVFNSKSHHLAVVKGEYLYVIGGANANDVWRSNNGSTWTEMTTADSDRFSSTASTHGQALEDNLYVITSNFDSDAIAHSLVIWRSADNGANWSQIQTVKSTGLNSIGLYANRKYMASAAMGEYIYFTGGQGYNDLSARHNQEGTNDVLRISADGDLRRGIASRFVFQ